MNGSSAIFMPRLLDPVEVGPLAQRHRGPAAAPIEAGTVQGRDASVGHHRGRVAVPRAGPARFAALGDVVDPEPEFGVVGAREPLPPVRRYGRPAAALAGTHDVTAAGQPRVTGFADHLGLDIVAVPDVD